MKKQLLAALVLASTSSAAYAAGPSGLDTATWANEIDAAFANVKGFSAVIVHKDGYAQFKSGGLAAPGQAMSWNHYGNIGSVKKMVGSLMLMRAIEDKVGRGSGQAISFQLNKPVYLYMPDVIRNATPTMNKAITFRHLLRHKSGIRTEHSSGNPFHDFLQPVSPANFGVRKYSNTNIKLLTYLIVAYVAPHVLAETNTMVAQNGYGPTNDAIIDKLGYYYGGIVQNQLLAKAQYDVFGTCWPEYEIIDHPSRHLAHMYWTKNSPINSGGLMTRDRS